MNNFFDLGIFDGMTKEARSSSQFKALVKLLTEKGAVRPSKKVLSRMGYSPADIARAERVAARSKSIDKARKASADTAVRSAPQQAATGIHQVADGRRPVEELSSELARKMKRNARPDEGVKVKAKKNNKPATDPQGTGDTPARSAGVESGASKASNKNKATPGANENISVGKGQADPNAQTYVDLGQPKAPLVEQFPQNQTAVYTPEQLAQANISRAAPTGAGTMSGATTVPQTQQVGPAIGSVPHTGNAPIAPPPAVPGSPEAVAQSKAVEQAAKQQGMQEAASAQQQASANVAQAGPGPAIGPRAPGGGTAEAPMVNGQRIPAAPAVPGAEPAIDQSAQTPLTMTRIILGGGATGIGVGGTNALLNLKQPQQQQQQPIIPATY